MIQNKVTKLNCNLTTPELQNRKTTVLTRLKSKLIERKELEDGYVYRFPGTDQMLNELMEFIKTERVCCDFFVFDLTIPGDKSQTRLAITDPRGVKEFLMTELKL